MFGGSGKLGRGGGSGRGGGVKRSLPPPPVGLHRPSLASARLPIGASAAARNRPSTAAPPAREEAFSLVTGDPEFGAIIRLTPDLVEEIRQLEAQGGVARIKFDPHSNNPSVIDVGGKEFRFTWSRELGDLCDIYEERKNGEDGHGLLVECGSAWRKLNVERILDESTKNHVKKLSEEAERQTRARKSIILEPTNPSVKNQVKSMAAAGVDGNMRRKSWQQKKEPPIKRQKVDSNLVPHAGLPKSVFKSVTPLKNSTKGMISVSPQPSPFEQHGRGTSASPLGTCNFSNPEDNIAPLNVNKGHIGNLEKEIPSNVSHGSMQEIIAQKLVINNQPVDLRTILITLLSENPKGMTLKALEKAVGETNPNPAKKIESIIKNIATYQAPGRYILKPGVELGSFKRQVYESGSSPSIYDHVSAAESICGEKATSEKYEQLSQLRSKIDESDPIEKVSTKQDDRDPCASDIKVNDNIEGRTCSSSESRSDSESGSDSSDSDSGSQSRSRSKSRSPAGSGSGSASSSDSESGGSSSGKEGSDVEVDIMTSDDEKEPDHKENLAELKLSPSSGKASDEENEQIDPSAKNQEGQVPSPLLDLNDSGRSDELVHAENLPINKTVKASEYLKGESAKSIELDPYRYSDERMSLSPEQRKQSESEQITHVEKSIKDNKQVTNHSINEKQGMMKEGSTPDQSGISAKNSKSKSKRISTSEYLEERPGSVKRPKAATSTQAVSPRKSKDGIFPGNSENRSSQRPKQDTHKDHIAQPVNKSEWYGNTDTNPLGYSLPELGRPSASNNTHWMQQSPDILSATGSDTRQSGATYGDLSNRRKGLDGMDKSSRHVENFGRAIKNAEGYSSHLSTSDTSAVKNMPMVDKVSPPKDKLHKVILDENGNANDKSLVRSAREISAGNQLPPTTDSHNIKSVENFGILKDNRHPLNIHKFDMEKPPAGSGKGRVLSRELSDLELGEFREPPEELNGGVRGQFDKKCLFKSFENRVTSTGNTNLDTSKGRIAENPVFESTKPSPANLRAGIHGNQGGSNMITADGFMDSARPQQRAIPPQTQLLPRIDHVDSASMSSFDRSAEMAGKDETRSCQGNDFEDHSGAHKKLPASMRPQNDNKHAGRVEIRMSKESKPHKSNALTNSTDRSSNSFFMENDNSGAKRRDSSDEDNTYSKYDKDKPELKGPIKDWSEFNEYVQEYSEKYGHYRSLNKELASTMDDFVKISNDLNVARERNADEYSVLLEKLYEMYQQRGVRHKQRKKAFVLLHEELKNLKQRLWDFAETCGT